METFCGIVSATDKFENSIEPMLIAMQKGKNFSENFFKYNTKSQIYLFGKNSNNPNSYIEQIYGCAVVFEGQIINKKNICMQLSELGFDVTDESEEKIIIQAYKCWGQDFAQHLNGMFVIVLFDFEKDIVLFVRDRLGKKNLYFYFYNDTLVFATELKAFFQCGFINKEINTDVLGHFIRHGFTPANQTILKGIYKLQAGCYMTFKNSIVSTYKYWDLLQVYKEQKKQKIYNYSQAKAELEQLIKTCILERISDENKFGLFLSSGIDSSLITALTVNSVNVNVNTYTIGVNDVKYNEADIALKISNHLRTTHNEHYITEQDLFDCIECLPEYYDEPFGDSSMIPSMILNKFVSDDLVIALGGDGGDEVFCGYPHYKFLPIAQRVDLLGGFLNFILPKKMIKKLPHSMQRVIENRNPHIKTQLVMEEEIGFLDEMLVHKTNKPYYSFEQSMGISNWQERRMVLDMMTTLPDDMIYKVNRACSFGGVEVLAPLLDYRIIEFSFRLPRRFKFSNGVTKKILRDIVAEYVPKEILEMPKRGFSVPAETWLRTSLKEKLFRYSAESFLKSQNLFESDYINSHLINFLDGKEKNGNIWWNYLMFQMWYEKYMLN